MPALPSIFSRKKGLTLAEVLASFISLGIVVLSAQTLILMSNRFFRQSERSFDAMRDINRINNYMCLKFSHPVFVQMDRSHSYSYDNSSGTYTRVLQSTEENLPATLSYPLLKRSETKNFEDPKTSSITHRAVSTYLNGWSVGSPANVRAHLEDEVKAIVDETGGRNFKSEYYDVYANSHTLISFMTDASDVDKSTADDSDPINNARRKLGLIKKDGGHGIIFASRCIENSAGPGTLGKFLENGDWALGSVIDSTDSDVTADKPEETALYILEGLKHRPFYFPKESDHLKKIKCCDLSTQPNTIEESNAVCKDLGSYTPVTYVIRFSSDGGHLGNDANKKIAEYEKSLEAYLSKEHKADYKKRIKNACKAKGETYTQNELNSEKCDDKTNRADCVDCVRDSMSFSPNSYWAELRSHFSYPITFHSVHELPIDKGEGNPDHWGMVFTAPSLKSSEDSIQLTLLNLNRNCLAGRECPSASNLDKRGELVNTSRIHKVHCPFHLVNLIRAGGGLMHFGSHFEN